MRLTEERIEEYVSRLMTEKGTPAGKDLKRKTRRALEGMMAILLESGHEQPDESDYAEYEECSAYDEKGTEQDIKRIKRYFKPKEERSEQLLMIPEEKLTEGMKDPEPTATGIEALPESEHVSENESELFGARKARKPRTKGEKRVQVSVYLEPETYETMKALSSLTHKSIGDMIAQAAEKLAEKNESQAKEILRVLQGFEMKY